MSEDLIRRSDAIKAIVNLHILADEEKIFRAYANNPHSMTTDFEGTLIDAINAIKGIPTIEPKCGEWVKRTHNTLIAQVNFAYCSECGQPIMHEHTRPLWSFCPNCGADMRGKDDE